MQQDLLSSTKKSTQFIPNLSTEAGNCLTLADWHMAGIRCVSCQLDTLLMKPGLAVLQELEALCCYYPWQKTIVLNASMLCWSSEAGIYCLRSSYDGSTIRLTVDALFQLIVRLKPQHVLLPKASCCYLASHWQHLPSTIRPYFSFDDVSLPTNSGSQVTQQYVIAHHLPISLLLQKIKVTPSLSIISGDFDAIMLHRLALHGVMFIESDKPAKDGMVGCVYTDSGTINILDKSMQYAHQQLDNNCQCQTCSQQLTRAYLHHLLQQTPLLAQRYLIQHNIYQCGI